MGGATLLLLFISDGNTPPPTADHRTLYAHTATRASLYAYTVIRNTVADIDPTKTVAVRK